MICFTGVHKLQLTSPPLSSVQATPTIFLVMNFLSLDRFTNDNDGLIEFSLDLQIFPSFVDFFLIKLVAVDGDVEGVTIYELENLFSFQTCFSQVLTFPPIDS